VERKTVVINAEFLSRTEAVKPPK